MPPDPNSAKTSVQSIQAEIVRRICFLDYPPGCQLKEAELATEFGVSRTPIRDAISRIKHLGLVETRNGVGTVVVTLSEEKIKQVYEMRLQLATMIGEMSPKPVVDYDKERIATLLDAAISLEQNFNARQYVELNDRLQTLIADLIGNTLLQSFWRQAYYQAASTWYSVAMRAGAEVATSLVQEISDLKEALNRDDIVAVGYVQRIQIGYGYQRIRKHLFTQPGS